MNPLTLIGRRMFLLLAIVICSAPIVFAGGTPAPPKAPVPVGFTVGSGGSILRSTNGGKSWVTQAVSQPSLTGVQFLNNSTGFITGYGDVILLSVDGGTTWGRKSANSTRRYNGVGWFDS